MHEAEQKEPDLKSGELAPLLFLHARREDGLAVGKVNGCGYNSSKMIAFAMLIGHAELFEAHLSRFFSQILTDCRVAQGRDLVNFGG